MYVYIFMICIYIYVYIQPPSCINYQPPNLGVFFTSGFHRHYLQGFTSDASGQRDFSAGQRWGLEQRVDLEGQVDGSEIRRENHLTCTLGPWEKSMGYLPKKTG